MPSRQGYPKQVLFIDLAGPLPETPASNRYILTCQDVFSRFVCLYPIPNKRTTTVAETLMHKHIAIFGCPLKIHSDNGLKFTGQVFTTLAAKLEIWLTHPPPYNPQSNQVERFHRTLNTSMRLFFAIFLQFKYTPSTSNSCSFNPAANFSASGIYQNLRHPVGIRTSHPTRHT